MNLYIKDVCKIGQHAACCKYLVIGTEGFECMKVNPANKNIIDRAWEQDEHVAQGDNCEGKENLKEDEKN
jgi:hypothetical protein